MSRNWPDIVTVTLGALVFAASLSGKDSLRPLPCGTKAAIELAAKRSKGPTGIFLREDMAHSLRPVRVEACAASHG